MEFEARLDAVWRRAEAIRIEKQVGGLERLYESVSEENFVGHCYKIFNPSIRNISPARRSRIYIKEGTIFRLRSGHCHLNDHLFPIGIKEHPLCGLCRYHMKPVKFLTPLQKMCVSS